MKELANDGPYGMTELYASRQFYLRYPSLEDFFKEFSDMSKKLTWRCIEKFILPERREKAEPTFIKCELRLKGI